MIKYSEMPFGKYDFNKDGTIISKRTNEILKPQETKKGYLRVGIYIDGKQKWKKVHQLIWVAFNGDIPDDLEIDHINNDRTDNRLENLQLLTHPENCGKKETREQKSKSLINHPLKSKPVIAKKDGKEYFFPSISEAKRQLKINNICRLIQSGKSSKGYTFKKI